MIRAKRVRKRTKYAYPGLKRRLFISSCVSTFPETRGSFLSPSSEVVSVTSLADAFMMSDEPLWAPAVNPEAAPEKPYCCLAPKLLDYPPAAGIAPDAW